MKLSPVAAAKWWFGEDLWREWCKVVFALILMYFGVFRESSLPWIAAFIFGEGLFRRLFALRREISEIRTQLSQPKAEE